ncbi:MAG: hypothetical protein ACPL1G_07585, partial [Thermodesulfovibrionales bacterium]
MKKNILIGTGILLIGILIGGIAFYTLGKITGQHGAYLSYPTTPGVPHQIIETSRAFSEIVNAVSPAVVNISTTKVLRRDTDSFFDDPFFDFFKPFHDFRIPKKWKEQSLGSGVVVSSDGY